MNYGELKAAIPRWTHRSDQSDLIPQFAANVTQALNRRFGITLTDLVADTDTNIILDKNSDVYLYGVLREAAAQSRNGMAVQSFQALYDRAIIDLNINYNGAEWDNEPLKMERTNRRRHNARRIRSRNLGPG